MKMKMLWMACKLEKAIRIKTVDSSFLNIDTVIPLSTQPGMVGMIPVFKSKRDAKRYVGKSTAEILSLQELVTTAPEDCRGTIPGLASRRPFGKVVSGSTAGRNAKGK